MFFKLYIFTIYWTVQANKVIDIIEQLAFVV